MHTASGGVGLGDICRSRLRQRRRGPGSGEHRGPGAHAAPMRARLSPVQRPPRAEPLAPSLARRRCSPARAACRRSPMEGACWRCRARWAGRASSRRRMLGQQSLPNPPALVRVLCRRACSPASACTAWQASRWGNWTPAASSAPARWRCRLTGSCWRQRRRSPAQGWRCGRGARCAAAASLLAPPSRCWRPEPPPAARRRT
jgi:hypothetical protein